MNILEARRRTLGGEVYKKTAEGNPVSVRSLARMRPGLNVYGKSHQNTVEGNQLFDAGKEKLSYSADDSLGLTTTYDPETGWFHTTGTLTGSIPTYWREENLFNMKSGVQYYFSVETVGENDYIALAESGVRNAFSQKNMSFIQHVDTNANQIYSNHSYEIGTEFDLKFRIMISMGSTALPWEPYKQPQSLTVQTPNGLPGILVSSGGNYTDENGQQWICDEIDLKRGKYVKRVKSVTFDGSENWEINSSNEGKQYFSCDSKKPDYAEDSPNMNGLSNMVKVVRYDRIDSHDDNNVISWIFYWRLRLSNLDISAGATVDDLKQFLSSNPITVYYTAQSPIETDLTPEQMEDYANLHTNRPTTVVSATDGAGLEITYKTKKSLEVT